jgi:hypothetical protein
MTILKEGAGGIWHVYDKDTGKGKRMVVRTSHSMQRSPTLKAWQAHFAKAAHEQKAIATAAKKKCQEEADKSGAPERYYSDVSKKRCKMSVLRLYLREALKAVADQRPEAARRKTTAATASEIRGIEF